MRQQIVTTARCQRNVAAACAGIGYNSHMPERPVEPSTPATLGEAMQYCCERLENSEVFFGHGTDNPWDEAVQLVLAAAGLPAGADASVLSLALDAESFGRISELLARRIQQREPLPYLLGKAWFAGLEFRCDRRAIIPRSPLAELILDDYRPWYAGPQPGRLLDLCCGGGCIGLAAAHYQPTMMVDLVDLDPQALELAAENAAQLGLEARANIICADLFAGLGTQRYDIILSNPPYVDATDLASMPAEYLHEPELALGSGTDGLHLTRRILAGAADHLQQHGLLVVEVGNSWPALEQLYPEVAFTWLEFEQGGHGVFVLSAKELQDYSASLGR